MEELSYLEKSKLPFELLLDPVSRLASAYTNNHRLIAHTASAKLVAFAEANELGRKAWDESKHVPGGKWRPLPDWATLEIRQRCVLLWIKSAGESDEFFASIPKK
jgi:hypothetical protein